LIGELEALGGDVDLVGHDWGAGHVYGVLAERPDLLRSWSADCAGLIHSDYEWHDAAQVWQTPEAGEEAVAAMFGLSDEDSVAMFESLGVPAQIAKRLVSDRDPSLADCVLSLYRSAAQPKMRELGDRLRASEKRPGLVLMATEDHYAGTMEMSFEVANGLGAKFFRLEGLGHWWMFDGAKSAAIALQEHWDSV
jgi:pimeloyl-ACP methyl ester carboxylesterase